MGIIVNFLLCIEAVLFMCIFFMTSSERVLFKSIVVRLFAFAALSFFVTVAAFLYPNYLMSIALAFSIGFTAAVIWYIDIWFLGEGKTPRLERLLISLFCVSYLYTIFLIDYHYTTIVTFYVPPVFVLAAVAFYKYVMDGSMRWFIFLVGAGLCLGAVVIQAFNVSLDPVVFSSNVLYGLTQGLGMGAIFWVFYNLSTEHI